MVRSTREKTTPGKDNGETHPSTEDTLTTVTGVTVKRKPRATRPAKRAARTFESKYEGRLVIGFDWRYLEISETAANHIHRSRTDLLGHTIMETDPGIEETGVYTHFKQAMENRQPCHTATEFVYTDGSRGWLEYDIEPAPEGIMILSRDITRRKLLEYELQESREQYRSLYEEAPVGYMTIDPSGLITQSNPKASKLYGYSPAEFTGRNFLALFTKSPVIRAKEQTLIASLLSGKPWQDEMEVFHKDGSKTWLDISLVPQITDTGKITGARLILIDITPRKQISATLEKNERKYIELFNNISNCIAVYQAVENGRDFIVINFNKAAQKIEKISREQVIGRRVTDVFPDIAEFGLLDVFRRVWLTGIAEHHPVTQHKDQRITGWRENFVFKLPTGEIVAVYDDITERKQQEQVTLKKEEQYHLLYENSSDAILLTSPDGRIFSANPTACIMLGRSEEEICRIGREGIIEPSDPHLAAALEERARTGKAKTELTFIRKDGSHLIGETSTVIFTDGYGETRTSMIIRDVTDRVHTQEALRISEERYRTLVATCPDGIAMISVDGTVTYASKKTLDIFGFPEESDVIGHSMLKWVNPEGRENMVYNFKATLKQGDISIHEYPVIRKNGEHFWIETNATVFRDKMGTPLGLVVIIRDIAERKRIEAALTNERENFQNSLEMSPFGVQIISMTGQLLHVNRTMLNMWGYSSIEELLKIPLTQRFTPESMAYTDRLFEKRKLGEIPARYEMTLIRKTGDYRDLRAYNKEITWNGEQAIQVLYEDVTERKQMEARITELNETLQLVRNINQLIVRTDNELMLLQQGCLEMVRNDRYPLAWIGFIKEGTYDILPVAKAGKRTDYVTSLKVTWDDSMNGHGPTGMAVKTAKPVIIRDIVTDTRFYPWRKAALQRGLHSSIALPLTIQGKVIGALNIYAASTDAFHEWELGLFTELAGDLSLGIEKIRRREEQNKVEKALADEAVRRRVLVDQSRDGIVVLDQDGTVYEANKRFAEMIGYSPEEVRGLKIWDWECQYSPDKVIKMLRDIDETGAHAETRHRRKDGSIYDVEISSNAAIFEGKKLIFCVCRDISERKKSAEELSRRAMLLDATTDAIMLHDLEGNVLYLNEAMCQAHKLKRNQVLRLDTMDQMLSKQVPFETHISELQRDKTVIHEIERKNANGQTRILEIRSQLVQFEGKDLVLVISRDITQRKQAEEELRNHERQFRELAESISDVFFAMDKELRFTYWNHASEILYGISAEKAIGKRFNDIVPESEARKRMLGIYHDIIANGKPQHFTVKLPGDNPMVQEINAYPTRDGLSVFARDITEQEVIHEKLAQSEERLHILFEDAPDAYCLYDLTGKLVDGNRAAEIVSGYSRKELLGSSFIDMNMLAAEEDVVKSISLLKKNANGDATGPDDFRMVRKDGKVIDVEVSTFPTRIGEQSLVLAIVRDVTERKKLQENMIVTDRLASIGELASGMAHELNNPLTTVIGFAELLLEKDLPPGIQEDIRFMCNEAKRTSEVAKNMLTFARKHPIVKSQVNINEIMAKVLEIRNYEHKLYQIQVVNQMAADLPDINADYFQLQQVFLNIVINAEYFMKEAHHGGTLTITTTKSGTNVRLAITDDGPGIPKENLNRIFDPFFTTKPVGKGTGLGLSICYGIINEHNGHIYAESELGKSSTFIIELPMSE